VTRLTAENESLMDISNALAAEKRQASEKLEALREQGKHDPLIGHMADACHRLLSHRIALLGLPGYHKAGHDVMIKRMQIAWLYSWCV